MWHTIAEAKNKYKGREGVLCATGPSADDLEKVIEQKNKPVLIGINRSIVLRNDFDFVFVDHHSTVDIIAKFLGRTKYICMPLFSRVDCNLNNKLVQQLQDRILLYSWVYQCDVINAPQYPLNDVLLYISWGNAQSIIHFARHIGLSDITILGCDGGPLNGRLSAKKIEEVFGTYDPQDAQKRARDYAKTRQNLESVAEKVNIRVNIHSR